MIIKVKNRKRTADRGPPKEDDVKILEAEQLGPNLSRLPNGNLLCKNVPIARVGWMIYGPNETPIQVDPLTGIAHVHRDAEALFDPACIGSFMGAAVVDDHPDEDVTPTNWKELGLGFVTTNVYRGSGADADVLLADLILTDESLIEAVLSGKREVSCGYSADYTPTGPGQGKQTNIIGNHVALVEKGRCGPRCAIGDHAHQTKEMKMTTRKVLIPTAAKRRAVIDARRKVLDAEEQLASVEEGENGMAGDGEEMEGGTHIHLHGVNSSQVDSEEDPTESRFKKLETMIGAVTDQVVSLTEAFRGGKDKAKDAEEEEEEAKKKKAEAKDAEEEEAKKDKKEDKAKDAEETEEEKKEKTKDSQALQTSYTQLLSQAELLVPGFRMPTFDAKALRKATVDAMCGARRRALDLALSTKDGLSLVSSVNGNKEPTLDSMTCVEVATLFNAAAGAKALLNNTRAGASDAAKVVVAAPARLMTIDEINKQNAAFWARNDQKA